MMQRLPAAWGVRKRRSAMMRAAVHEAKAGVEAARLEMVQAMADEARRAAANDHKGILKADSALRPAPQAAGDMPEVSVSLKRAQLARALKRACGFDRGCQEQQTLTSKAGTILARLLDMVRRLLEERDPRLRLPEASLEELRAAREEANSYAQAALS